MENPIKEVASLGYFEKLDLWYTQQFKDLKSDKEQTHLHFWSNFLRRNSHRISPEILQIQYDFIKDIIRKERPKLFKDSIDKPEFELIARYLVHSDLSLSKIFEPFLSGSDKENVLLEQLRVSTSEQIIENHVLSSFYIMFENYFQYVQRHGRNLPEISHKMDVASMGTKIVVREFAEKILEKNPGEIIEDKWLCSYYLLDYLYSSDNSIWSPEKTELYQDMNHPLSHYWISSSHNTYLTGNQYSSPSSVKFYEKVLRDGCRCVEIDIWNGPHNQPIVAQSNGKTTPTTAVNLTEVLETIKANAFVISPYPVIIWIENNCNQEQTLIVVKYLKQIFGEMLLPHLEEGPSKISQLPSPEQLKHKIILAGRNHPGKSMHSIKGESSKGNLMTGELWKKKDDEIWIPCIFTLTSKELVYTEKQNEEINGQLNHEPSVSGSKLRHFCLLHEDQLWFHGKIPGGLQAAIFMLKKNEINGSFLVRESDTMNNMYSLCFYYKDPKVLENDDQVVYHCVIHQKVEINGSVISYFLKGNPTEEETFPSIFKLVEHYKENPIITQKFTLEHLTTPLPISKTHEDQQYFYQDMDRETSERILEKLPIHGAFLARSDICLDEIIISFRFENRIKHCRIERKGRFLAVSDLKFEKLEQLVDHYSRNVFYQDMKLTCSVGRELYFHSQQSECTGRVVVCSELLSSVTSTVLKSCVRAIKSFEPPNPEFLSFKKGDVIINVVKEPDGWWWGMREDAVEDDAVSFKKFQSTFTEEIKENFGEPPLIRWELGTGAEVEKCTDQNGMEKGIKYYIVFKYFDGAKQKLGVKCSKRKANEWVEKTNHAIAVKMNGNRAFRTANENSRKENSELRFNFGVINRNIVPYHWSKELVNVFLIQNLNELTGDKLFSSNAPFFVWYHQYALSRVYPKAFRVDSSNFNPVRSWNYGSQMVSLNFQTPDKAMQLNRGKFKENGNCGYVLKPDFMINGNNNMEKPRDYHFALRKCYNDGIFKEICLTIISARHLEKLGSAHVTPVVEVEINGVEADCSKVKTSAQETGLNPFWNETFQFKVHCPELALIQFRVFDIDVFGDRHLLGEGTVPFRCIRQGYRSVGLQNGYGTSLLSSLLVHVAIN